MTTTISIPYRGELLLTQLAAYGLAGIIEDAAAPAFICHDPTSLSFAVTVETDLKAGAVADGVIAKARRLEPAIEQDLEPGQTGNNRRPSLWARATFTTNPERPAEALAQQTLLLEAADAESSDADLLLGLGMSSAWLPASEGPSKGATTLDGVLGNHTSDFVRGVLRRSRAEVAALTRDEVLERLAGQDLSQEPDRTGWAPPGTPIDPLFQWISAIGLQAFPVSHQARAASLTPASWRRSGPSRRGITLPLFDAPTSYARARAILNLEALASVGEDAGSSGATLRAFGINEVIDFTAQFKAGGGTSVAFSFSTAHRIDV